MSKYIINGHFLCRNLTGIERFSYEILYQLDKIVEKNFLSILIPKNAKNIPTLNNIEVIISKKELTSFWKWTQFYFGRYVKKNNSIGINFANECPVFNPGYAFLHDIYCKLYPQDFTTFRDKLVRLYSCFMYKTVAKRCKKVFTVSEFSKKQIVETYKISPEKVFVIPNGWEHFSKINEDFSIFDKYPELNDDFYFTLGSLSKRKNLKWIAEYAKKNINEKFAISGKMLSGLIPEEIKNLQNLPNVLLLGYVSDEQVKALMKKCKAFILPSYYEGFGIPPLEALSVGAKIVISNSSCLPEIYQTSAYYINPDNTDINISDLLKNSVSSAENILGFYTYKNASKIFFSELNKN